jgi:hypothetical protein
MGQDIKKLKELLTSLKEKKNLIGKIPKFGLVIHMDSTYKDDSGQLNIAISSQSTGTSSYDLPLDKENVDKVTSGLESELGAAIKSFSDSITTIIDKYLKEK